MSGLLDDDGLFENLYGDDETEQKPAVVQPDAAPQKVANGSAVKHESYDQQPPSNQYDAPPSIQPMPDHSGYNSNYDAHPDQHAISSVGNEENHHDGQWNMNQGGYGGGYGNDNDGHQQGMAIKEDGKMFIGGLNWETTDESLKDYFSQFGEVAECTVMRDGPTGRSRGFGFLTFRDPKTVNIVMVKEHWLDGKIIDPKRAIPRDEQEKTSKIFVGGVSSEATETDFRDYFAQFGRVIDSTLMMDKETGRPRGFGFVTFDSEAAVENALAQPMLEILGKPIEVKKAQPRGNIRDRHFEDEQGGRFDARRERGRGFDREQNQQSGFGQQQQQPQQTAAAYNGMTPQMMAQYWSRMTQYWQQMQAQMAAGRGRGNMMPNMQQMGTSGMQMNPAMFQNMMMMMGGGAAQNPQMMQMMQMQQMQQMMAMQQQQQQQQQQASQSTQQQIPQNQPQQLMGNTPQPQQNQSAASSQASAQPMMQSPSQQSQPQQLRKQSNSPAPTTPSTSAADNAGSAAPPNAPTGPSGNGQHNNQGPAYNYQPRNDQQYHAASQAQGPESWEGMYDDAPAPSLNAPTGPGQRTASPIANAPRGPAGAQQMGHGPGGPPLNAPTGPRNPGPYRGGGRGMGATGRNDRGFGGYTRGGAGGFHPYARNERGY